MNHLRPEHKHWAGLHSLLFLSSYVSSLTSSTKLVCVGDKANDLTLPPSFRPSVPICCILSLSIQVFKWVPKKPRAVPDEML